MGRRREAAAVMSGPVRHATVRMLGMWGTVLAMTSGCASAPSIPPSMAGTTQTNNGAAPPDGAGVTGFLGDMTDKALQAVGLKKPEVPELAQRPEVPDSALPDWRVNWRLFASDALNVDERGQSLALLVRIYRLRNTETFLQAPYETFGDPVKEKQALNDDLLSVREVQLLPGQRHEALDKIAREARYIGIVALYRQPAQRRWRYAFSSESAQKSGLHLGAHACAMSVQVGQAIGIPASHARVTSASCS